MGNSSGNNSTLALVVIFSFALATFTFFQSEQALAGHTVSSNVTFNDSSLSRANNSEYGPGQSYSFGMNIVNNSFGGLNISNTSLRFQLGLPNGTSVNFTTSTTPAISPTLRNLTHGLHNITFTQVQLGPAGTYNFTWFAATTEAADIENKSSTTTYVVAKNSTVNLSLFLFINNNTVNTTVTYPTAPDVRGNSTLLGSETGGMTFRLFRENISTGPITNSIEVTTGNPAISLIALPNATFRFVYNTTGNENYSSGQNTSLALVVQKGSASINSFVNNVTTNLTTVTYPNLVDLRGNSSETSGLADVVFDLWYVNTSGGSGSTKLTTGTGTAGLALTDSPRLANGTYKVVYNHTGGNNWTSNATGSQLFFVVLKGAPTLFTFLNNNTVNTTITYPTAPDARGNTTSTNIGVADLTFRLFRDNVTSGSVTNSVEVATGDPAIALTRLPNGTYKFVYNTTGGQNWTSGQNNSLFLSVLKGAPSVTLLLNSSAANLTIGSGTSVNVTATVDNSEGALDLYNGSAIFSSGSGSSKINITTWAGSSGTEHNITGVYNETQNFSRATSSSFFIKIEGTAPTLILYNSSSGAGGFPANGTFYKSGQNFTLNVNVSDNLELPTGGFNVSVFLNTTFAANISNSSPVTSLAIWANKTFQIPNGPADGSHTLNVSTLDSTGNRGTNTSFIVKIDNTAPTLSLSVSDDSITTRGDVTVSCSASDGGSGVDTTTVTVTKPGGSALSIACGDVKLEGDDTDESGDYEVSATSKDKVGNEVTKTATFKASSPGGGDGGGGGGGGATVIKETNLFSVITPGAATIARYTNPELGIREIVITVRDRANNVRLTVKKLSGQPATVTHTIDGNVFKYVDITAENLPDSNVASAKVRFAITKAWLQDNNIDSDTIALYRYTTRWDRHGARKIREDATNVHFEADTPGFSTFAMGGQTVTSAPEQPPAEERPPVPTGTEEVVQPPTEEEKQPSGMLVILGIVLILAAGLLYWKREALFGR